MLLGTVAHNVKNVLNSTNVPKLNLLSLKEWSNVSMIKCSEWSVWDYNCLGIEFLSGAYLEPGRTSMMNVFYKSN